MKVNFIGLLMSETLSASLCQAQLATTAAGKFVAVNGAKIYYEEYGQGDPLLLLHGFGQTAKLLVNFSLVPGTSQHFQNSASVYLFHRLKN
jgi:hypothetical protein